MGMFSVMCAGGCGHPLLCGDAAGEASAWMTDGVAVTPQGSLVTGTYDGYGRLSGTDIAGETDATAWHRACRENAGRPAGYLGPSDPAQDQGWFLDDGDHDMPDPRSQQTAAGQAPGTQADREPGAPPAGTGSERHSSQANPPEL